MSSPSEMVLSVNLNGAHEIMTRMARRTPQDLQNLFTILDPAGSSFASAFARMSIDRMILEVLN